MLKTRSTGQKLEISTPMLGKINRKVEKDNYC